MKLFKRNNRSIRQQMVGTQKEIERLREKEKLIGLQRQARKMRFETGVRGSLMRAGENVSKSLEKAGKSKSWKAANAWTGAWEKRHSISASDFTPLPLQEAQPKKKGKASKPPFV